VATQSTSNSSCCKASWYHLCITAVNCGACTALVAQQTERRLLYNPSMTDTLGTSVGSNILHLVLQAELQGQTLKEFMAPRVAADKSLMQKSGTGVKPTSSCQLSWQLCCNMSAQLHPVSSCSTSAEPAARSSPENTCCECTDRKIPLQGYLVQLHTICQHQKIQSHSS